MKPISGRIEMTDNNAGSMTIVDEKYLHDEWCHWVIEGTECSCYVAVIRKLEARIKALEANTSKSVLRRIDAQLGVDDETE